VDPFVEEVNIAKKGVLGKVKLGFKYLDSKIHKSQSKLDSIYVKYNDISKRKFIWTVWEKERGNSCSYAEFKESWDPNTKVWKEIKKHLKFIPL